MLPNPFKVEIEIHLSLCHPSLLCREISNNNGIVETVLPELLMLIDVLNIKDFHNRTLNACHGVGEGPGIAATGTTFQSSIIRQSSHWLPSDL